MSKSSQPAATQPPRADSYADVRRACHAWLMRKDPAYRKTQEQYAAHREGRAARPEKFAGF